MSDVEKFYKKEKGYRGYGYDDHPEWVPQITDRIRNIQETPLVGLPMPVISQMVHVDQQKLHFDDESL